MAYTVTELNRYDDRRYKVTLDYGEVTFLLYKGECAGLRLSEGTELAEDVYLNIMEEILLPRAKKRVLYYMKNSDKTRYQIERKLRDGLYPDGIIEKVMEFLDKYGLADDKRYADNYIEELKRTRSRREIRARLSERGIFGDEINRLLSQVTDEDEYGACVRVLGRKYPNGLGPGSGDRHMEDSRRSAYAFLARKGYARDVIERALNEAGARE